MLAPDLLVIGSGPAGMAAATEAARAGLKVFLAEQRATLGGAIYRQPAEGASAVAALPSHRGRWAYLQAELAKSGAAVLTRHVFIGIDQTGIAMLDDRNSGAVLRLRPKAIILALGAVERIAPRPGWQQAGVIGVGGLQVMLKEGRLPQGRILLAGSGPLLLALAMQMTDAGQPPVAVIEAGDPLAHPLAGFGILRAGGWRDSAALMRPVLGRRFPWLRGHHLRAIGTVDGGKVAVIDGPRGERRIGADLIALHDGLRPNDFGVASAATDGPFLLRAGDMRDVLGARAAETDGARAARTVLAYLRPATPVRAAAADERTIARERHMQDTLARMFAPVCAPAPNQLPDETVICRCEGRTAGDLRAMLDAADQRSGREIRLNGRFGMGACQGRYCADTVREFINAAAGAAASGADPETAAPLLKARWPLRPVSLGALASSVENAPQSATGSNFEGAAADHLPSSPCLASKKTIGARE